MKYTVYTSSKQVQIQVFPIRNFDPITCNQLIRHIIDCWQDLRVTYNKQAHAAEDSLIINLLLCLN